MIRKRGVLGGFLISNLSNLITSFDYAYTYAYMLDQYAYVFL
jgi:hypothetical protein